jgi:hypothetical protein
MKENRIVVFGEMIYLSDDKTLKYEFLREAHMNLSLQCIPGTLRCIET